MTAAKTKPTPLRAIRNKCLDCCAGAAAEVRKCVIADCALWAFRMGRNPFATLDLSDEERRRRADRVELAREAKRQTAVLSSPPL